MKKWERGEERNAAVLKYMKIKAPLYAVGKNFGCICLWCSTSSKTEHRVRRMELKHRVVNVGECAGLSYYQL